MFAWLRCQRNRFASLSVVYLCMYSVRWRSETRSARRAKRQVADMEPPARDAAVIQQARTLLAALDAGRHRTSLSCAPSLRGPAPGRGRGQARVSVAAQCIERPQARAVRCRAALL